MYNTLRDGSASSETAGSVCTEIPGSLSTETGGSAYSERGGSIWTDIFKEAISLSSKWNNNTYPLGLPVKWAGQYGLNIFTVILSPSPVPWSQTLSRVSMPASLSPAQRNGGNITRLSISRSQNTEPDRVMMRDIPPKPIFSTALHITLKINTNSK